MNPKSWVIFPCSNCPREIGFFDEASLAAFVMVWLAFFHSWIRENEKYRSWFRENDVVLEYVKKENIVREFVKFEIFVREFVNHDKFEILDLQYD